MNTANFEKVIGVLDDLQAVNIVEKYAIGGAFAAILHNEPISTIDLDVFFFLVEKSDGLVLSLEKIYGYAKQHGFPFDHEFINIYGWLVQFIEASHNDLWKEAVENAGLISVGDFTVPVIGREHLAAMWLFAGRAKDYQKIAMFWEADILDMNSLPAILARHHLAAKWEKEKWRFINDE
jgi:hypothetical protein